MLPWQKPGIDDRLMHVAKALLRLIHKLAYRGGRVMVMRNEQVADRVERGERGLASRQ